MNFQFSQLFDQFNTADSYTILAMLLIAFLFGFLLNMALQAGRTRPLREANEKLKRQQELRDKELTSMQNQLALLNKELEKAKTEKPAPTVETEQLRAELAQAKEQAMQAEQEKNNFFSEIDGINEELELLQASQNSYLSTIDELNKKVEQLHAHNQELIRRSQAALASGTTPETNPSPENDPVVSQLEQKAKQLEGENKALKEELAGMKEQSALLGESAPDGGPSILGFFGGYTSDEQEADDLTLIKGIGPSIAKKLNKLGIYTLEQISHLSDRDIQTLAKELDYFQNRIAKDDWVGQARKFLRLKMEDPEAFLRMNDQPGDTKDLKIVNGIGPAIEKLLKASGIETWENLADTPVEQLKDILVNAGDYYRDLDPTTWPIQARLAENGHWDLFDEYQEQMKEEEKMPPHEE